MTIKGEKASIIQIGSQRYFPLLERNMKRIAHKRKDKIDSHGVNIRGTRRKTRK
jgi:hypothetical protein